MNAYWDSGVLLVDCAHCCTVHTPIDCPMDTVYERDKLRTVITEAETLLRKKREKRNGSKWQSPSSTASPVETLLNKARVAWEAYDAKLNTEAKEDAGDEEDNE
jgi:hypothetical protein